jgi:hypothetical protein
LCFLFSSSIFELNLSTSSLSFFRLRLLFRSFFFRRIVNHDLVWDWIVHDARSSCDIFFTDNTHFDDDDDDVLDLWLRVWLNFVKKRIRDENDDDHDERWFLRDRTIDTNMLKDKWSDAMIKVEMIRWNNHYVIKLMSFFEKE